jgi:hypothetical protein
MECSPRSAPLRSTQFAALTQTCFFQAVTRYGPLQQFALICSTERIAAFHRPLERQWVRQQRGVDLVVDALSVAANCWSSS